MTDGIIQEVIKKWFISNIFPNGVLTHELTYIDILILQSKLIEKIKNEFKSQTDGWTLKKLIGEEKQ